MQMNTPAPRNAIDENRQGLIGKPIDRVEGRLKVMGMAPYAHEVVEGGDADYGFIVPATIARGRVASIDASAVERALGVLLVMTHKNVPKQAAWGPKDAPNRYARSIPQLGTDRVEYYGQAVAFAVAQTFEQARSAARLVKVQYEAVAGEYEMATRLDKGEKQKVFLVSRWLMDRRKTSTRRFLARRRPATRRTIWSRSICPCVTPPARRARRWACWRWKWQWTSWPTS